MSMFTIRMVEDKLNGCILVKPKVNGITLNMEVDTGASVSIISENTYKKCFQNCKLAKTNVKLKTYTGEKIEVLGQIQVTVKYQDQVCELPLIVVKGNGFPLFGRNWLKEIRLNWSII